MLDDRIAGAALVGVTTVQDWSAEVAPAMHSYDRIMPYLPSIMTKTDLQYFYAAVAPRPLLLVDATDRKHWPAGGFRRARDTAAPVYRMLGVEKNLTAADARSNWGISEIRSWLHDHFSRTKKAARKNRGAVVGPVYTPLDLPGDLSCPQ